MHLYGVACLRVAEAEVAEAIALAEHAPELFEQDLFVLDNAVEEAVWSRRPG